MDVRKWYRKNDLNKQTDRQINNRKKTGELISNILPSTVVTSPSSSKDDGYKIC